MSSQLTQLLFIIDATERTGQNWPLLHRVCLAIFQACRQQQQASGGKLQCGLLLVRSQAANAPLCTPSGFTSDDVWFRRWLRGVLFDGGPGAGAQLEALLMAAQGELWAPGSTRHAVLVSHAEPKPLPASVATAAFRSLPRAAATTTPTGGKSQLPPGQSAPASAATSCWSPVPELMAAAGVSLSLVAPRPMPRLSRLHAAVCAAATREVPRPTCFAEAPELLVVCALLPKTAAGTAPRAPSPAARGPSPYAISPNAIGSTTTQGSTYASREWNVEASFSRRGERMGQILV